MIDIACANYEVGVLIKADKWPFFCSSAVKNMTESRLIRFAIVKVKSKVA